MTIPTFPTLAKSPTFGTSVDETARVLKAPFGDGYVQRAKDGINNVSSAWSLIWTAMSQADRDTFIAFLRARGGAEPFLWTPPDGATAVKFVCEKWKEDPRPEGRYDLRATFEQSFAP